MIAARKSRSFAPTAWAVIFSFLLPVTAVFADEEDDLRAESERLERAYDSFTDGDFEKMRGNGVLLNVVNAAYSTIEGVPVAGEWMRNVQDTNPGVFSETELAPYLTTPSNQKNTQRLMTTLFRETVGFHQRVGKSSLAMEKKADLMKRANLAFGRSFAKMSSYFDNYIEGPESLAERRAHFGNGGGERAMAFLSWAWDFVLHKGQYLFREVSMLFRGEAVPIPFIQLRSERRTDTINKIAADLRHAVRHEASRVMQLEGRSPRNFRDVVAAASGAMERVLGRADERDAEQVAMTVVAIDEMLKVTESSEVMQVGLRQRWVRRAYFGLALLAVYFGGPEVGPIFGWTLGLAERTTVGPLLAMIQATGTMLWAAHSRTTNSGLAFHRSMYGDGITVNGKPLPLVGRPGLIRQVEDLEGVGVIAPFVSSCKRAYEAAAEDAPDVVPLGPRRTRRRAPPPPTDSNAAA